MRPRSGLPCTSNLLGAGCCDAEYAASGAAASMTSSQNGCLAGRGEPIAHACGMRVKDFPWAEPWVPATSALANAVAVLARGTELAGNGLTLLIEREERGDDREADAEVWAASSPPALPNPVSGIRQPGWGIPSGPRASGSGRRLSAEMDQVRPALAPGTLQEVYTPATARSGRNPALDGPASFQWRRGGNEQQNQVDQPWLMRVSQREELRRRHRSPLRAAPVASQIRITLFGYVPMRRRGRGV